MSAFESKRLIVVVGPTAVGKTDLAIKLAEHYQTEVISADSRQIFKEMTIGTAKPGVEELSRVKHHFISIKSVEEQYDAGQYGRDVITLLDQLFLKHDNVILCGGSGMYVKAVCEGFDDMPDVPQEVRQRVIDDYDQRGLSWLQQEVEEQDPDYFSAMDQKNPQRLMRALELLRATGRTATELRRGVKKERPFKIIKVGLDLDREELYSRIDQRVDQMIDQGLEAEARGLFDMRHLNALQTVGYQELFGVFAGEYDFEEGVRLLKRNSRRYAKRQLTWFRRDQEIRWFYPNQFEEILHYLNEE